MFITQLTRHELIASTCGSVGLSKINLFQSHLEQEPLLSFSCFLRSCSISAPVSFMCSSLLTGNLDESALISQRGGSLYVAITAHSTNTEEQIHTGCRHDAWNVHHGKHENCSTEQGNLLLSCKVITCNKDACRGHRATIFSMETRNWFSVILACTTVILSNCAFGCRAAWINTLKIHWLMCPRRYLDVLVCSRFFVVTRVYVSVRACDVYR